MREYKIGDKVVFLKNVSLSQLGDNGNNPVLARVMLSKKFVTISCISFGSRGKAILYLRENSEYWLAEWFKPYIGEQLEFDFNA
jgi:hypothetical protein